MKTLVLGALRALARRWPRAGVLVAFLLAWASRPLGHGIADGQIAEVFPELPPGARRAVRQQTWENFLRGEALEASLRIRGGGRLYPRLIRDPAVTRLRPPLILATFHVGPFQAIGAVLRPLPADSVAVARGQYRSQPGLTLLWAGEDETQRTRTFHRTISALRAGKYVVVTLDGHHHEQFDVATIEVPLLGRSLPLARGAFALARLTRTPIVPVALRWRGTAMETTVGAPLSPDLGERGMAVAAAAWLEGYLRERPGELSVFILERLRPQRTD